MSGIIIFLALLVGITSAISSAANKAKERARGSPGAAHVRPVVKTAVAEQRSDKPQPAETASAVIEKGITIQAPLQLHRRDEGKKLHHSLKRIFKDEERLLTAFIFHEIMGPPRSLRRR